MRQQWIIKATPADDVLGAIPVGYILEFMGDVVPESYLTCDGESFSALDYPELAVVLVRPAKQSWWEWLLRFPRRLRPVYGGTVERPRVPDFRAKVPCST